LISEKLIVTFGAGTEGNTIFLVVVRAELIIIIIIIIILFI